jgi:imidazolonepropionase-like amidohydrolase
MKGMLLTAALLIVSANPALAAPIALDHVRLIDGAGGPAIENATMVFDHGRILAIGRDARPPAGAEVIDLKGETVMPGLVCDHAHLGLVDGTTVTPDHYNEVNILRQLRQYEAYGVTTVTALGLNRSPLFDRLRTTMHSGATPGADVYGVDQGIGVPDGAPPKAMLPVGEDQIFRPTTPMEARQAVDIMAAHGTDLIKLWLDNFKNGTDKPGLPKMQPAIYQAVIEEAHAKGLRVAAHIHDLVDAKAVVAAGADIIAHGVRDQVVDEAFISAMKARSVWYIPTLGLDQASYIFAEHPEWLSDRFLAVGLQPALRAQFSDPDWRKATQAAALTPASKRAVSINMQNLKILFHAGVNIGFGTDSGAAPARIPGWAEHQELKLMVEAGLTPLQAITIATRNAAALMHLDDRGTLSVGRRADFIVLAADPSLDIGRVDQIESVWRGGVMADGPIADFSQNNAVMP